MANKLFTWDELSDEVEERDPAELMERNAEGGWLSVEFMPGGKVEVRTQGRHIALETWAKDAEEATVRFMDHKVFRDYAEDKEDE